MLAFAVQTEKQCFYGALDVELESCRNYFYGLLRP